MQGLCWFHGSLALLLQEQDCFGQREEMTVRAEEDLNTSKVFKEGTASLGN